MFRPFMPLSPLLALVLALAACAPLGREDAGAIAAGAGFERAAFAAGPFTLIGWRRGAGPVLIAYLEGDGFAWVSRTRASDDPTPLHPTGLRLAAADPSPAVLYLGRPCQYVQPAEARNCSDRYWTDHRFAPEVVEAVNRALDQAKAQAGAGRLVLIGYSGGGAVAALAAARRSDVAAWATVASPLDSGAWTRHHEVSPLSGSLDPTTDAPRLAALPQIHFAGAEDETVPAAIVRSFLAREGPGFESRLVVVPGADHGCCWARRWPELRPLIPAP